MFLCGSFTQRPMNDQKIELSDGRYFSRQQLVPNSIENFISNILKKTIHRHFPTLTNIKTFWTLEPSEYCKSGRTFFSSEPVAVRSDCRRLPPTAGRTRKRPVFTFHIPKPKVSIYSVQDTNVHLCAKFGDLKPTIDEKRCSQTWTCF